jgi:pre-mRNA-processing factor 6
LLERARKRANTPRVWMRSVTFERELGNVDAELAMLNEAVELFPNFDKLWIILGQFHARNNNYEKASSAYELGLAKCSKSAKLWVCAANFEMNCGFLPRARAILEKARLKIPRNEYILHASVKVEVKSEDSKATLKMLSKALQDCPKSGLLWAYAIELEPRAKRRGKCYDALQVCSDNVYVCVAVGRVFWGERNVEEAQKWFERAIAADADIGDAWAYYYKLLKESKPDYLEEVIRKCMAASPRHGEAWCAVSKAIGNAKLKTEEILEQVAQDAGFLL